MGQLLYAFAVLNSIRLVQLQRYQNKHIWWTCTMHW